MMKALPKNSNNVHRIVETEQNVAIRKAFCGIKKDHPKDGLFFRRSPRLFNHD